MNIAAGLSESGIAAPMTYKCGMDSELFNFRLEHCLLPEVQKNSLAVIGNASFHKSEKTKELVENFFCRPLFLPPYSPDLNPIENFLAFMKAKIKKTADGTTV